MSVLVMTTNPGVSLVLWYNAGVS